MPLLALSSSSLYELDQETVSSFVAMYEVIDELPGHFLKHRQESRQSTKSTKGNVKNNTRHQFNMPVSRATNAASQFAWIWCLFAPWIRDPGWKKLYPDPV
jgi:hypothetical protein